MCGFVPLATNNLRFWSRLVPSLGRKMINLELNGEKLQKYRNNVIFKRDYIDLAYFPAEIEIFVIFNETPVKASQMPILVIHTELCEPVVREIVNFAIFICPAGDQPTVG